MNFYKTLGLKNSRIDVADALRGLAVAGIILYHSVEHFNMYDGNIAHVYTLGCDDWMADVLALLLSGKMYGIFALLFGLSFFIMNDNQQQRGNCFSGRFAWRMFLLAMLGIVNTAFFDGDILFSYAIYGLVLIPLSYLPTKWLWWVVAFLFIQPVEIYSLISGWQVDASALSEVYGNMYHGHQHGTFLENAYSNLRYGQVATYYWCLMKGRHTQTICLFILGMLVGRKRWFYNENNNLALWKKVLAVSILVLIVGGIADVRHMETWNNWLYPIYNFFILSFVVSGFVVPAPVWQDEFDQLLSPVYHRLWTVCLLWLQSPDETRHHLCLLCGYCHGGSAMPLLQPLAQVSLPWSFRGNLEEADLD